MNRFFQILVVLSFLLIPSFVSADERGLAKKGEPIYYNLRTEPGEYLKILLRGDGDGDIDCYLYDVDGNLVKKDDDTTNTCLIEGQSTAYRYRLKVANSSDNDSFFVLRVTRSKPDKDI